MPLGRPRAPGTEAERAEARRAKVRKNVQAFRRRQKEKKLTEAASQAPRSDNGIDDPFGAVVCREGYLDISSTSTRSPSISAKSSPGLGGTTLPALSDYDYADPDSWIWRFPQDLVGNIAFQETFITAMRQSDHWWSQLADTGQHPPLSYEPFRALAGCGSTWFHIAMMETVDPGLEIMNDACLASALTIISRERQDNDMGVSAAYIQSRALRQLRRSLQRWSEEPARLCPISLSLAALTCAMSEIVVSHSWPNFASHLNGVGCLLSYHDPASLCTQSARELFYGYRSLEATFAFMHGRSLFLADPRWIDMPWKDEISMSPHPLHKMLDIAFRFLPEIAGFQQHGHTEEQQSSRHASASPKGWETKDSSRIRMDRLQRTQQHIEARDRLYRLQSIATDLDAWEVDFRNQQAHLGGLHHRKETEWPGLYDYAFDFTSLAAGSTYTMYSGIRVRLAEAIYAALCICSDSASGSGDFDTIKPLALHNIQPNASQGSINIPILASTTSTAEAMRFLLTSPTPRPGQTSRSTSSPLLPTMSTYPLTPTLTATLPSQASTTSTEKLDALLQGLRWARQALQSLEFFHTGSLKDCGWLATLFAFDAAWAFVDRCSDGADGTMTEEERSELLCGFGRVDLGKERRWCVETARRFEAEGVPLLGWR